MGKEKKTNLSKPETYDCPLLSGWFTRKELRGLVKELNALAGKEGRDIGKPVGFVSDPVDLDAFYELLVDRMLEAVRKQEGMLVRAFERFAVSRDEDAGLRFDEFEELLGWCVGATVSKDKRERMFNDLLKAGGDDDHDGEIDNGTIFSICVMRAKDCVLARPRETRCFWQLPWDIEM